MKDQKALLVRCLKNDILAVVLSAKDPNSVPALMTYLEEAKRNGCSPDFIADFSLVVNAFIAFRREEPGKMELPNL